MPKRMGADMREAIQCEDRSQLDLERTPWSNTGFIGVIKVGNKFQARLQVPGDGRGGSKKRKQHSLPGLFDTAEDAAVLRAVIKRGFKGEGDGAMHSPPKQNKAKSRAKPRVPQRSQTSQCWSRSRRMWQPQWRCPLQSWTHIHRLPLQRRFRCSPCALRRCSESHEDNRFCICVVCICKLDVALKCAREDNNRYCRRMKIVFRNPAPPLAGPDRAWSRRWSSARVRLGVWTTSSRVCCFALGTLTDDRAH